MTHEMQTYNERKAAHLELRLRVLAFALDNSQAFSAEDRAALEEEAQTLEAMLDGVVVQA